MFYSHNDILKLEKFHKDKSVTERENARVLLNEMASYAESSVCRVRQLLHYFGESFEKDCGFCDNCVRPREKFDGKEFVELVIQTAVLTGERCGMAHLVKVIRGSENQYVKSYEHDKLDVFGKGSEDTEEFWKSVIRQSLLMEFLEKDIDYIGVLKVTEKGDSVIRETFNIQLTKDHDFSDLGEEESEKEVMVGKAYDETLFEMLKKLRKQIAKVKGLPPYVIFQDPSLEEMATTYPTTIQELEEVIGVGKGKAAKFGEEFVNTIELYVEDNDIITVTDVRIKSAINKSRNKVFIIQQIDKMMDLEEISDAKKLSMDDLFAEIESIISSGTQLNLNYYIDQVIDEERQEYLYYYFLTVQPDSVVCALGVEDKID